MNKSLLRAVARRRSVYLSITVCLAIAMIGGITGRAQAKRPQAVDQKSTGRTSDLRTDESSFEFNWHLLDGCTPDHCPYADASGNPYVPQPPVVATPAGSTYSVSHGIYGDPDGPGPQQPRCILFSNPLLPGAPDDIVRYDGLPEAIRTDIFGTVPTVNEAVITNNDGTFQLVIDSFSPPDTDLFPDRFVDSQGTPIRDACFVIGLDDPLDWAGADTALAAVLSLRQNGAPLGSPINITGLTNPWDGSFTAVIEDAAGLMANQVHLEVLITKNVPPPANNNCANATPLAFTGSSVTFAINNIGATTDGLETESCNFEGSSQIGADIWYNYTAGCTGDLSLDLCGSFFDTKVAVYNGCGTCPPSGAPVACNDDADGCGPFGEQSKLLVPVTQGQCYRVRLGGFLGDQGPGTLRVACRPGACCNAGNCTDGLTRTTCEAGGGMWNTGSTCASTFCAPDPPPNDRCDHCDTLTTGETYTGRTTGAGGSITSSCGGGGDVLDAWNCWTADCTGVATFSLCDSDFDTTLSIFDACEDGQELACNDDACGLAAQRSEVDLDVVEGTTYYVRVSGFGGATGDYELAVSDCQPPEGACCLNTQICFPMQTEDNCLKFNGTYLGDGSVCLADQNGNGKDDACETCLHVTITDATPLSGTVDARAPHPVNSDEPNLGIGGPDGPGTVAEPIEIKLSANILGAEGCFDLCETVVDAQKGPNAVANATYIGNSRYRISLDRPITAPGVTTIRYLGDGSFVEYTAHPGNVNGDGVANYADVAAVMNCCILGLCPSVWGDYSCDLDHSGGWTPSDILMGIDLLNGAGSLNQAMGSLIPENDGACP